MMSSWEIVLWEPARTMLSQISRFLMSLLLVIVILIVGWIIAKIIKTLVIRVLRSLKLDELSERIELDNLLAKGNIGYSLSELIGVICYWLMLLVTLVVAINSVGLSMAADLLNRIVLYIPNVIASIFILIAGMFVATLLKNIVQTAAGNAGLSETRLLGKAVEIAVIVFTVLIALEQLNIAARIIDLVITIVLASLGLGLALAFGLGCKDVVGKSVGEFLDKLKKK